MKEALLRSMAFVVTVALTCSSAGAKQSNSARLAFEGTLLAHTQYAKISCGILFITQAGRYRVDRVIEGRYEAGEIIIAHSACGGDAFAAVGVGQRVRVQARGDVDSAWQATELGYRGTPRTIHARYFAPEPPVVIE